MMTELTPLFAVSLIGVGTIGWGWILRRLYIDVIKDGDRDWDYVIGFLIFRVGLIAALAIIIGVQLLRR
jgi:hypothetical protein